MDESVATELLAGSNSFKQFRTSCGETKDKCDKKNEYKYLMKEKLNIRTFHNCHYVMNK